VSLDGTVEGTAGNICDRFNYGRPRGDPHRQRCHRVRRAANDDLVYGYGGNDTIYAGAGNDVAFGGASNDGLMAVSGDDTLRAMLAAT
jgi:Ca2+-binding RTX toxin-like protein